MILLLRELPPGSKTKRAISCKAVVTSGSAKASLPDEVGSLVHDYWSQEWRSKVRNFQNAVERIVTDFGPTTETNWEPVSVDDLRTAARNAQGSHGPDNWSAEELRVLPPDAVEAFHRCLLRWFHTGQVPKQFLQSRQINLFKPHKTVNHEIKGMTSDPSAS